MDDKNSILQLQHELQETSHLFATTGLALFNKLKKITNQLNKLEIEKEKPKAEPKGNYQFSKEEVLEDLEKFFVEKQNILIEVLKTLNVDIEDLRSIPVVKTMIPSSYQTTYNYEGEMKFVLKWRFHEVQLELGGKKYIEHNGKKWIITKKRFPVLVEIACYTPDRFVVPKTSSCFNTIKSIVSAGGCISWYLSVLKNYKNELDKWRYTVSDINRLIILCSWK